MLFHASIFAFAILFFGLLECIVAIPSRFLMLAILSLAVLFRMSSRFGGSSTSAIVPTLFSLSTILLLFFVSSPKEKHLFIFLSSLVFYVGILGIYRLRQYAGDMTAESMLSLVAMTTLFFLFSAFYGIFLNFQRFTEGALMVSYGFSAFLVGLSIFSRSFRGDREKPWLFSVLLALFSAQIAWIGSFWPFSYLTAGVLSLMFLSPLWDMIQSEAIGTFSKKRLVFQIILILLLGGMVLWSSEWLPVV